MLSSKNPVLDVSSTLNPESFKSQKFFSSNTFLYRHDICKSHYVICKLHNLHYTTTSYQNRISVIWDYLPYVNKGYRE